MAIIPVPFDELYQTSCTNCDSDLNGWDWNDELMLFDSYCSECGAEFTLIPATATLEVSEIKDDDDE